MVDLSIYVDGQYFGRARASAYQVATHTDLDLSYAAALEWASSFGGVSSLVQLVARGDMRQPRRVQIINETRP
jgi:hypothetical protein